MDSGNTSGHRPPNAPIEFKLKSTQSTSYSHNLMTLLGPPVNVNDFTTPVRLVRDPNSAAGATDSKDAMEDGASDEEGSSKNNFNRKKRKTRIIHQEEQEEELSQLKDQEKVPWLLEDFDGQHSYTGQLVIPDAKYVIFVNHGSEFQVLPASRWYRFTPRLAYHPLSIEEAEEKMAGKSKNEDYDRWLMKKRLGPTLSHASSEEASGTASVRPNANTMMRLEKRLVNLDEEGFDFTEFVDDDDGDVGDVGNGEDEDPTMPRIAPKPKLKNLSDAGKQVKHLVKNLDKSNYLYDSDEDDDRRDPYADDDDQVDSDEEAKEKYRTLLQGGPPKPVTAQNAAPPRPMQPQKTAANPVNKPAPSRGRSTSPDGTSAMRSGSPASARARSKSPGAASSVSSVPGASKRSSGSSSPKPSPQVTFAGTSITEAEIASILKEGPMKTKDLIFRVKAKLKADPANKDLFREIVRKIASVKPSASQEDDKLLELKPEYR